MDLPSVSDTTYFYASERYLTLGPRIFLLLFSYYMMLLLLRV